MAIGEEKKSTKHFLLHSKLFFFSPHIHRILDFFLHEIKNNKHFMNWARLHYNNIIQIKRTKSILNAQREPNRVQCKKTMGSKKINEYSTRCRGN